MMLREGYYCVVFISVFAGAVTVTAGGLAAWVLWVLVPMAGYLFRLTRRAVPPSPLAVVCPIDGVVDRTWQTRTPDGRQTVAAIRIKSLGFGELAIRAPTEGKVVKEWFLDSGELPRDLRKEGTEESAKLLYIIDEDLQCRRYRAWIQTDEKDDVITSVAGSLLRPHWYVRAGERVGQGQLAGMFWFSAAVTVMVPGNCRIRVQPGAKVRSGSDILANLVRKPAESAA